MKLLAAEPPLDVAKPPIQRANVERVRLNGSRQDGAPRANSPDYGNFATRSGPRRSAGAALQRRNAARAAHPRRAVADPDLLDLELCAADPCHGAFGHRTARPADPDPDRRNGAGP